MIYRVINYVGSEPLKVASAVIGLAVVAVQPLNNLFERAIVATVTAVLSYNAMQALNKKFPPTPFQQATLFAMSFTAASKGLNAVRVKLNKNETSQIDQYFRNLSKMIKTPPQPLHPKSLNQLRAAPVKAVPKAAPVKGKVAATKKRGFSL